MKAIAERGTAQVAAQGEVSSVPPPVTVVVDRRRPEVRCFPPLYQLHLRSRHCFMQEPGQIQQAAGELSVIDYTVSPAVAPYIVAFHQDDSVRLIGFGDEESARAMYDVVSQNWAKVLSHKSHPQVSLRFLTLLHGEPDTFD